jgi:triacylglycerol lipase
LDEMRRLLVLSSLLTVLALGVAAPAGAVPSYENQPEGANDFDCVPSAAHPNPVVLVHGLGARMDENWGYLSPLLAERGWCVFALTYGLDPRGYSNRGGVIPVQDSAPELGELVDRVRAETGAEQVDLVGHSEGTFMPQYWLKFLGGAPKVDRYVAITPLYDGTDVAFAGTLRETFASFGLSSDAGEDFVASFCGSCPQLVRGSDMVELLKENGVQAPGVTYTTIMSRYDELVVPYTSGVIDEPGATNIVIQDVCPNDVSDHSMPAFDPVVARLVFNALDPAHARPAD